MLKFQWYYFFVLMIISNSDAKKVPCSRFCSCNRVDNLFRATCTNKRLITVETEIAKDVQHYDLSYNQISDIDDNIFNNLKLNELRILNISHNKIGHIHMNSFNGLSKLKILDLSYNSLGYVLEDWFKSLISLEELYLRGNQLRSTVNGNRIIFVTNTLKVLDISDCGLTKLADDIFTSTPNLRKLDVSSNHLQQINSNVIKPLKQLHIINIDNNRISCNDVTKQFSEYANSHHLQYKNPCKKNVTFERMMVLPQEPPTITTEETFWEVKENLDVNCNSTTVIKEDDLLMTVIKLSPILAIAFPFIVGLMTGLILGCSIQFQPKTKSKATKPEKTTNNEDVEQLMLSNFHEAESTPAPQRKILPPTRNVPEYLTPIVESTEFPYTKSQNMSTFGNSSTSVVNRPQIEIKRNINDFHVSQFSVLHDDGIHNDEIMTDISNRDSFMTEQSDEPITNTSSNANSEFEYEENDFPMIQSQEYFQSNFGSSESTLVNRSLPLLNETESVRDSIQESVNHFYVSQCTLIDDDGSSVQFIDDDNETNADSQLNNF